MGKYHRVKGLVSHNELYLNPKMLICHEENVIPTDGKGESGTDNCFRMCKCAVGSSVESLITTADSISFSTYHLLFSTVSSNRVYLVLGKH
jgi:hypothetical protein